MPLIPPESSNISDIYLLIAQYPMLASRIRRQMYQELFRRSIKVIHIPAERPGCCLEIAMDGKQPLGYLLRTASAYA